MIAQSPQASAPAVAEVVEDLSFEMIAETAAIVESLAVSLGEAAFRRDHAEVRLRLGHLRLCVIALSQTLSEMNGESR